MRYSFILTVGLNVAFVAAASAQAPAAAPPAAPIATAVNLSGPSNDYQVGPGDLLVINVVGHDDMTQTLRISSTGEISFPRLGLIRVGEMTAFEVEDAIAARLREAQLIQEPFVLVTIREYQAKPIYVSGAVTTPGEFIMSQDLTVADAVLLAGGLRFNAASEGVIHRRISEGRTGSEATVVGSPDPANPGTEIIKVDLQPMKEGRFLASTIRLQRGDVLVVPEMNMNPFYVVGEVIEPRNFFYPPGRTLMASQAISWAGGPTPTANMAEGMLVRYDERGNRKEIKVDFGEILRGKQQDFRIEPNDVIFIPGSRVKTITHGLLLLTDEMVMSESFRIGRRMQLPEAPERAGVQP